MTILQIDLGHSGQICTIRYSEANLLPISRFSLTSQSIKRNLDGSIFGWLSVVGSSQESAVSIVSSWQSVIGSRKRLQSIVVYSQWQSIVGSKWQSVVGSCLQPVVSQYSVVLVVSVSRQLVVVCSLCSWWLGQSLVSRQYLVVGSQKSAVMRIVSRYGSQYLVVSTWQLVWQLVWQSVVGSQQFIVSPWFSVITSQPIPLVVEQEVWVGREASWTMTSRWSPCLEAVVTVTAGADCSLCRPAGCNSHSNNFHCCKGQITL